MGELALAMIGIITLAPVLASLLRPVVVPVFSFLGADPAMFAGTILACDMGGGALAQGLTNDPEAAILGGLVTGAMLGATLVFTIPVALGILQEKDRPFFAKGVLCGIVTIPVGILAAGLVAGISLGKILRNLVPIILIGGAVAVGLWKWEKKLLRGFGAFGKGITWLVTLGLGLAIFRGLTGFAILPGMEDIGKGFQTVGEIAIILAGAFPLVAVVTKLLQKPLGALGRKLGVNSVAAGGFVATLANSIATFDRVKDMDDRGKVVNIAFAVSAAFTFGDHMAFAASFAPEYLLPLMVGKLVGGISAVFVALWLTGT
jgi:ethanolamine transporter